MAVTLRGPLGSVEVCYWWEPARSGRRLAFDDAHHARSFARALCLRAGNMASVRGLLDRQAHAPLARRADDEVVDLFARWLAAGRIRIALRADVALVSVRDRGEEEAPLPPAPMVREAPLPPPAPPEPATLRPDLDAPRTAQVMKRAAALGLPFCEECLRKQVDAATFTDRVEPAVQAAHLREAARTGVPFCEECVRRAAARGPLLPAAPGVGAPAAATPSPVAPALPAAPAPPTFAASVDAAASAAVLRKAAQNGVPFCAECLKKQIAGGSTP